MATLSSRATPAKRAVVKPGNGLGEVEEGGVLALAEVLGQEELRQADDLGATGGGLADVLDGTLEVLLRLGRAAHLHQAHGKFIGGH